MEVNSPQSPQLTGDLMEGGGSDKPQCSKTDKDSTVDNVDNNDESITPIDQNEQSTTSKDDDQLKDTEELSPDVSDKEHSQDETTQRSDTNTPLLDDTDCNHDENNVQRNQNETPLSDADHDEPNRSESVNTTEQDDNNSSLLDENAVSQQSAISNDDDNNENNKTELPVTSNFNDQDQVFDDGDLSKFPDQILAETSSSSQNKDKENRTDFEEININESEKEKSSHNEETDALGEDRTQIISRSPRGDNNKYNESTTTMDVDQNDESINMDQSSENMNMEDTEMTSEDNNDKADKNKNDEVTVERDEEPSEESTMDTSILQCDEQVEEGEVIEAAPNESENICLLPDEEKELTGAEKEHALQARQQAEKEANEAEVAAAETADKTTEKDGEEKENEQEEDGTRVSTPTEEINLDDEETEQDQTGIEAGDTTQQELDNQTTDGSAVEAELQDNEIKELTEENVTEQKCYRCNKMKLGYYKFKKDGELCYLCDIKCVNVFRTLSSREKYTLICRRIIITSVMEKLETCEKCKMTKMCYFRYKSNPTNENYVYICENPCLNEFIGKNIEKYLVKRKKYLVEELLKEVEDICVHCKEKKTCKYSFLQDQDIYYICGEACYFLLSKEEPDRFRIKKRTVRVRDLGGDQLSKSKNQIDNEPKIVARTEAEAQAARLDRNASFVRSCAQCFQPINNTERLLQWETIDFCNEVCLGKYQNTIGSKCKSCLKAVPVHSLGKYCVRFGFELRQFCSSACLDGYKTGLKVCSLCQQDITKNKGFLAPVGDQGHFRDFCSQNCLKRYEELHCKKKIVTAQCAVCNNNKEVRIEIILDDRTHHFCSSPCFSAFKFVNNIIPDQCSTCTKFFERKSASNFTIYQDKTAKVFCSKICMHLFITAQRVIVPCQWCKVKKYNFDMIQKQCGSQILMLCSLNCLTLYGVSLNAISMRQQKCDQCGRQATPQYHLTMSDATIRNFCTYQCVMVFQSQFGRTPLTLESVAEKEADTQGGSPFPTSLPKRIKQNVAAGAVKLPQTTKPSGTDSSKTMTVKTVSFMSNIESLASDTNSPIGTTAVKRSARKSRHRTKQDINTDSFETDSYGGGLSVNTTSTQTKPPARRTVGTITLEKGSMNGKTKVITVPPLPPVTHNRMTMCKPNSINKAVSCRPNSVSVQCQTEKNMYEKVIVPVPVPIYVPQPMYMYSAPFPVPVPIPLPIPVPIFIPTTRNSANGILKEIKKIQDKMPSNPYEADLLMMAEMVAGEKKKEESDSEDDSPPINNDDVFVAESVEPSNSFGEDMLQMALKMATEYEEPAVDLESAMATNTITPSVHPHLTGDLNAHQMIMIDGQRQIVRGRKRVLPIDGGIQQSPARNNRLSTPPQKKRREIQQQQQQQQIMNTQQIIEPVKQEPVEKPDANMCLKYTFGVNAWKQWVMTKNADLEKSSIKRKPFKSELLQMTADELNYSLCLFVKEVRKPNGSEYAPDTIYYLVLGIQQYLYENGRIDNIFTDPYYERFTDCLDEVAKKFSILYNDSQYIVTRVEEEHLWECKQLGAHSPHVLLSTLMFFNTKHFNLTTVEEHMQLSFSHIMKHWKRSTPGTKAPGSRNVLLRFYPPQTAAGEPNPRKKKVYEQQENEENPLRCPVKLYEFYLSKCPESVKTRNDVFYLQPERSCVPDSPVWYSTQPLSREALSKMLHRVKMVKEINIALLTS